jgi:cyclophilin family peptidyl-prolyl cis-trans isomerase
MLKKLSVLAAVIAAICIVPVFAAQEPNQKKEVKQMPAETPALPRVELVTSMGSIVVELDEAKAPVTVKNFLTYVREGFYDGTIFHRVIPGFMIQGGGMLEDLKPKPAHAPIKIESNNGLKNNRGTIAMARTNDPNSATSQFFINLVNNDFLNYKSPSQPGYAVFGKVISGMSAVDAIAKVPTHTVGMSENVPVQAVVIISAREVKP